MYSDLVPRADVSEQQAAVCLRIAVDPVPVPADAVVGLGRDLTAVPIHGLRHRPAAGESGWYIWAGGEIDRNADGFFQPMHASHLADFLPQVMPYLALPQGWPFLLAPGHEDLWFDESLLATE
jgi:hypothetical protein